jgi:hypothetical protein
MTDTPNHEWEHWQAAWRTEPSPATPATPVAELQRRLLRHRRAAWVFTALDVVAFVLLCGLAVYAGVRHPTLPILVWAVSVFVFSAVGLGFAIWNRRDALLFSAQPTADFLALLRVRQERRERTPRFLVRFVAAEIAFGLVYAVIWRPGSLGFVIALYAAMVPPLAFWWWRHRKRLLRERAQLDALCRDDGDGPPPTG